MVVLLGFTFTSMEMVSSFTMGPPFTSVVIVFAVHAKEGCAKAGTGNSNNTAAKKCFILLRKFSNESNAGFL